MEKLIALLNEYKKIKGYDGNTKITNYDTDTGSFTNGYSGLEYEIVIGKRYGFIKWLVENDKINFKKFDGDSYDYLENPIGSNNYDTVWDYKTIIQWLSISDTPIEDLISYLK